MPVGVITNVIAVACGGLIGAALGNKLTDGFKDNVNMIFGCCAMTMGVANIVLMQNMPAVIFAIIVGSMAGLAIHLGDLINRGGGVMQRAVSRFINGSSSKMPQEEFEAMLLTTIVLFCASGTGIYGALIEGMSGDSSILLAKSILDFFTALIFACTMGIVVSVVAVPQLVVFLLLFALGGIVIPHTNESMIADFKACGGMIMLATGFRMLKLKMFPIADMLPAMLLVMPVSLFWTSVITPIVTSLAK